MSLLNKKQVKTFAIEEANRQGRLRFKRTSKTFLDRIERRLEAIIRSEIQSHPSRGITFK